MPAILIVEDEPRILEFLQRGQGSRIPVLVLTARTGPDNAIIGLDAGAGDVRLDLLTRRAERNERVSDLSAREFALLETFVRQAGEVLSREQRLAQVWGLDHDPGSNVVNVYVRKLGHDVITTVRGMGY